MPGIFHRDWQLLCGGIHRIGRRIRNNRCDVGPEHVRHCADAWRQASFHRERWLLSSGIHRIGRRICPDGGIIWTLLLDIPSNQIQEAALQNILFPIAATKQQIHWGDAVCAVHRCGVWCCDSGRGGGSGSGSGSSRCSKCYFKCNILIITRYRRKEQGAAVCETEVVAETAAAAATVATAAVAVAAATAEWWEAGRGKGGHHSHGRRGPVRDSVELGGNLFFRAKNHTISVLQNTFVTFIWQNTHFCVLPKHFCIFNLLGLFIRIGEKLSQGYIREAFS